MIFSDWWYRFLMSERIRVFRQFIKFCIVGVSNLILDSVVYWSLTRIFFWYYLIAKALSFLVAVTWSFFLNYRWTFRLNGLVKIESYVKFFLVSVFNFFLSLELFYLAVDKFGIYDLLAIVLLALLTAITGFFLNKFWAFNKKIKIYG